MGTAAPVRFFRANAFSPNDLREQAAEADRLETDKSPFQAGDWPKISDPVVHWVKPKLLAALQIEEWTPGGALRHVTYKGLREDTDPREVVWEGPPN